MFTCLQVCILVTLRSYIFFRFSERNLIAASNFCRQKGNAMFGPYGCTMYTSQWVIEALSLRDTDMNMVQLLVVSISTNKDYKVYQLK